MSGSLIDEIESVDSRRESLSHAESPEDLRTSETFFDAGETDPRNSIPAAAETPLGSCAQSQRCSPDADAEEAELDTDYTWPRHLLVQTQSSEGPASQASDVDDKLGSNLGELPAASADTQDDEDIAFGTTYNRLTQATSLPALPTMMTDSLSLSLSAQSSLSNLHHRTRLSYFLNNQEERLALEVLRSNTQESRESDPQPRSLKQIRPLARYCGYELDAHCCLQEARIASDVDNQMQLGGSASSVRVGVSRNASCRSLLPDSGEQLAKDDSVSSIQTPRPPLSARRRGCQARRNQRFKPRNEATSQASWSPVRSMESWNPVHSMELVADSSQRAQEAKVEGAGDAKRGVAFLEEQLKGLPAEGHSTSTGFRPRRQAGPPQPKRPATTSRLVITPKHLIASLDQDRHSASLLWQQSIAFRLHDAAIQAGTKTYQKMQPRTSSNNAKDEKLTADLEGNPTLSETDALRLKDTCETLRVLVGADYSQSARSRLGSQRWSENWALQNSAAMRFRLPVDFLQKPRGASGAKRTGSLTAGSDIEPTQNSEAEQQLEPEPSEEQQQEELQSPSNASAASPRKKRKNPVALPPLRILRPAPAASILPPKRGAKDADGENTLPCLVEDSHDES